MNLFSDNNGIKVEINRKTTGKSNMEIKQHIPKWSMGHKCGSKKKYTSLNENENTP